MRKHLVALVCAVFVTATQAQNVAQLLVPTPISFILSAGRWIIESQRRVYYIEVVSRSSTFDQARNEGFRLAVEQAVGSLISSETAVQNQQVVRDEIISYASGYVDRFEIIQQVDTAEGVILKMKVWVAHSGLATRLLNRSEAGGQINGPRVAAQVETIMNERYTGDRLLRTVLADYPRRAFRIEILPTEVSIDRNRVPKMRVPFKIRLAPEYLESLWAALKATAQSQVPEPNISMVKLVSGKWFNSSGGTVGFNDTIKTQLLAQTLIGTRPSVLLSIQTGNNYPEIKRCYRWAELDQIIDYHYPRRMFITAGQNFVNIDGSFVLNAYVDMHMHSAQLENITNINLEVIPGNICPN